MNDVSWLLLTILLMISPALVGAGVLFFDARATRKD